MSRRLTFASGSVDPEAYVPREATTRCLDDLEDWAFHGGPSVALLSGPSGIGKSLMLRLLEGRVGGRCACVYVGNPTFAPPELCRSILDALKVPPGDAPEEALVRAFESLARERSRILLLMDDVELLPTSTEAWLRQRMLESDGTLIAVMAVVDESHCERLLALYGREARLIPLTRPMQRMETASFVHSELSRSGVAPELVARFDESAIDGIHERSEGLPAQALHEVAMWLERGEREDSGEPGHLSLGASIVSVGENERQSEALPVPPAFLDAVPSVPVPDPPAAPVSDRRTSESAAQPAPAGSSPEAPTRDPRSEEPPPIPELAGQLAHAVKVRAVQKLDDIRRWVVCTVQRASDRVRRIDWSAGPRAVTGALERIGADRLKLAGAFALGISVTFAVGQWWPTGVELSPSTGVGVRAAPSDDPETQRAIAAVEPTEEEPVTDAAPSSETVSDADPPVVEAVEPAAPTPTPTPPERPAKATPAVAAAPPVANIRSTAPAPPPAVETSPTPQFEIVEEPIESAPPEPIPVARKPAPPTLASAPAPTESAPARETEIEPVAETPAAEPEPEPILVGFNARPWATIWIDGEEVGDTPLAEIPVTPGPHRVAALMPDGRRIERDVVISTENRHLRFE